MHHISAIKVDGFWGKHSVKTELHRDVTFLIGENGTGKTTLINLIAACLSADFATLDRLPFSNVEIILRNNRDARRKPKITVSKLQDKLTGGESIEYNISESSRSTPVNFTLEDIEEQRMLRRRPTMSGSFYLRDPRRRRDFTGVL